MAKRDWAMVPRDARLPGDVCDPGISDTKGRATDLAPKPQAILTTLKLNRWR
jgi:hypothetical protein